MKRSEPGANGGNGTSTLEVAATILAEDGPRVMLALLAQEQVYCCMPPAAGSIRSMLACITPPKGWRQKG